MEPAVVVARHRSALSRANLSRPFRTVLADGLLAAHDTIMDYGCGRGDDSRHLLRLGFDCVGWDPVHAPTGMQREADVVNLGYVVNVIESEAERRDVLQRAWALARRVLVVSARLTDETPRTGAATLYSDGLLTRIGTFQKFYEQPELRSWIEQVLGTPSVAAAPGIFYVFRNASDRAAFMAARFRRAAPIPRLRVSERLYAEHQALLESLAGFISNRGRLPAPPELPTYAEIVRVLGNLPRAFRVLEQASDKAVWERVREARSQDLLMLLALSRFEGRPKPTELAVDLQLDVKAFFGSYAAACKAADDLLFSLGRAEKMEEAYRAALVGKLMPTSLYVHTQALSELPTLLRLYEGCARGYAGTVPGANIIKLGRREPKVSYLSYPEFERDPHPALASSVSVHLQTFRVRERSYRDQTNPPVLHRKEEFLGSTHPLRNRFARLTRLEEAKGLFSNPASIGTREGWTCALRGRGLTLRGHRLVRADPESTRTH